MNTPHQELESAIRKACGDTMELEFGCEVEVFGGEYGPGKILYARGICQKHKRMNNCGDCYDNFLIDDGYEIMYGHEDDGFNTCHFTDKEMEKDIKILGRELNLADVLRTIGNMMIICDAWGNFYEMEMKLSERQPQLSRCLGRWDLSKTFSDQSDECKMFLHSILCK